MARRKKTHPVVERRNRLIIQSVVLSVLVALGLFLVVMALRSG